MHPIADSSRHPALAEAHRTLFAGGTVTDSLIAAAIDEARQAHDELTQVLSSKRRLDLRATHLGEALGLLMSARTREDATERFRVDLALAVATARTNDYVLHTIGEALKLMQRAPSLDTA